MPQTIPINPYLSSKKQQNRTEAQYDYFMLMDSRRRPAWNTLISSTQMSWIPLLTDVNPYYVWTWKAAPGPKTGLRNRAHLCPRFHGETIDFITNTGPEMRGHFFANASPKMKTLCAQNGNRGAYEMRWCCRPPFRNEQGMYYSSSSIQRRVLGNMLTQLQKGLKPNAWLWRYVNAWLECARLQE